MPAKIGISNQRVADSSSPTGRLQKRRLLDAKSFDSSDKMTSEADVQRRSDPSVIVPYASLPANNKWHRTAQVELIAIAAYLLAGNASSLAIQTTFKDSSEAAVGAVFEAQPDPHHKCSWSAFVTCNCAQVHQLQVGLANAAYSISFQRFVAANGNRTADAASFANTEAQLRHMQAVYSVEYLTIVNTSKHIILSLNNDRLGEIFDPEGVVTAAESSGIGIGNGGNPVWCNGLLTYDELLAENPGVYPDRYTFDT
eukprot:11370-Heterococcus_DN1.PRE.10